MPRCTPRSRWCSTWLRPGRRSTRTERISAVPPIPYQRRRRDLADSLRRLREETGLSGSAFARKLEWLQSRVSKLERGSQWPTEKDIRDWVRAANADASAVDMLMRKLH